MQKLKKKKKNVADDFIYPDIKNTKTFFFHENSFFCKEIKFYDHTKINAKFLPARKNDAKIVEKIDVADDFIYHDKKYKTFFFMKTQISARK